MASNCKIKHSQTWKVRCVRSCCIVRNQTGESCEASFCLTCWSKHSQSSNSEAVVLMHPQVEAYAKENDGLQRQLSSLQGPTDLAAVHEEVRVLSQRASESAAKAEAAQASEQSAKQQLSTLECAPHLPEL